jgi:hypothetical protein
MPSSAQTLLIRELEHARRLHEDRRASPARAAALDRVAQWQARRLNMTYADLARDPRYAGAIAFFQTDLYGGADFSRRDADLARVVPLMVRLVPTGVIATIAMAMELSTLSQELDRALIEVLDANQEFTVAQYCAAYCACGNRAERTRQIALIARTGRALDRYVRTPFVRGTLESCTSSSTSFLPTRIVPDTPGRSKATSFPSQRQTKSKRLSKSLAIFCAAARALV